MARSLRSTAILFFAIFLTIACGTTQAPASSSAAEKPAAQPSAEKAPAPETGAAPQAATAKAAPKTETARAAKAPAAPAAADPPQAAKSAMPQPTQDVIILKGSPMGGVKFMHLAHSKDRAIKCETCHHAAKADSPLPATEQHCTACHTPVAKAPMKTKRQAAFHNPTATAGVCIDCHKAENAKGKKAPVKCLQCHQKANA